MTRAEPGIRAENFAVSLLARKILRCAIISSDKITEHSQAAASYDKATFRSAVHIATSTREANYQIKTEGCEEEERRERQTRG